MYGHEFIITIADIQCLPRVATAIDVIAAITAADAIAASDITVAEPAVSTISAAPVPEQMRAYVGRRQRSQASKLWLFWDAGPSLSQPQ